MAIARFAKKIKRPHGVCLKMATVAVLGLCFVFFWSFFSSPSSSLTIRRGSFDDIAEPVSANPKVDRTGSNEKVLEKVDSGGGDVRKKARPDLRGKGEKKVNGSISMSVSKHASREKHEKVASTWKKEKLKPVEVTIKEDGGDQEKDDSEYETGESEKEEEGVIVDGDDEEQDSEGDGQSKTDGEEIADLAESGDTEVEERTENLSDYGSQGKVKKKKMKSPVFDPKEHYSWKICNVRSKHNYIPCIDNEGLWGRLQSYRHTERSCPRRTPMCLVPLPRDGYGLPVTWPDSKTKILYKNVAHPRLSAFIKKHNWLKEAGDYLTFPPNQTEFQAGVLQYLELVEEMVPDIEWGKNVRVVLDIGCRDSSFVAALLDKDVLTLSLGLKDDLVDLAQVALERGFPAFVSFFVSRRLPFPSGVFDAVHCGSCSIRWHSKGGKLLLEINRILRPNGYFIMSTKHENVEEEEAMTTLTASICWNILSHRADEQNELGVKIYQKPESNDIYEIRRKKHPTICKENENPDAAWYVPMKSCIHPIPSAIEQHGTEWPEEWPKRLESYPEWLNDKEKAIADTNHWRAIVKKSYLVGLGIDWSTIRNVMDMKSIYGGFAAALANRNVWVMNVVPVHAPDTLPFIFDRGLFGVYHDWCESFGTYPRSYDLLHADHLFSRLKNRCEQPVSIVVEMDRLLRPGGWLIARDKVEVLDPLEGILRSLHWEIRLTYVQDKEGILCAQKNLWRP